MYSICSIICLLWTPIAAEDSTNWPAWRGAKGDAVIAAARYPIDWTKTDNVVWKVPVPGRGHSSPIVWGDRLFLTSSDESKGKQSVLAFGVRDGKQLWAATAHEGTLPKRHSKNSHASATPACDGERVYAAFVQGTGLYVTALDLDGKKVWQKQAGAFKSEHGYGSSPVLFGSLVIVNGDNLGGCFMAALDCKTGDIIWKVERKTTGLHGSYSTPIVANTAGKPQLIMMGMSETVSYDSRTGKSLWRCTGPAEVTACTAAWNDHLVFLSGGYPEKELFAVRADGTGDVTRSHVVWRTNKGVTYVPSPVYYQGHLYVVNDGGIATCFEAETGKQVWQERLAGAFSSSPLLIGDRLYVANEAGKMFVLRAGPKYELLATNDLADGGFASPTPHLDRLFVRTNGSLYCIGK